MNQRYNMVELYDCINGHTDTRIYSMNVLVCIHIIHILHIYVRTKHNAHETNFFVYIYIYACVRVRTFMIGQLNLYPIV